MKKSIMVMLSGLLVVFAMVLIGCNGATAEEVGTQNTESGSEEVSENMTENDKYAYLEEKGCFVGGQDAIGIQIALNEKYGMVYEEQIILYRHPECGNYGITAYDEPLVVAVDVSEFEIFDCGVTLKDGDYYVPYIYGDFDGDGHDDCFYTIENDTYKETYEELLAREDSKVVGSMDEDVTIITFIEGRQISVVWGHENDPNSEYHADINFYGDAVADTTDEGLEGLADKITVLTAPNAIYE